MYKQCHNKQQTYTHRTISKFRDKIKDTIDYETMANNNLPDSKSCGGALERWPNPNENIVNVSFLFFFALFHISHLHLLSS